MPIRRMILGLDEFHGYLAVANKAKPPASTQAGVNLTYWFSKNDPGEESVMTHFHFLGLEIHSTKSRAIAGCARPRS